MMVIRKQQMDELVHNVERRWQREFASRLRAEFSAQTANLADEELIKLVEEGWANALELDIEEREDIYRFLKLYFLPAEVKESAFIQSVLIRILNNLNLSGTKRLDFIDQQIVNRNFSQRPAGK